MALNRYQFFTQDSLGNILPGALVTVRKESDNSLATLYVDSGGVTPKANPFAADGNAYAFFYAQSGLYRISVSSGIYMVEYRDVQLSNAIDININNPQQNQILQYDLATQRWINKAGRDVLSASRAYYVRSDGNNGNDGLSNTAGGAFLTVQRAIDIVYGNLDLNGFDVSINIADGTYSSFRITSPQVGAGRVTTRGNLVTPTNVTISGANTDAIYGEGAGARMSLAGLRLTATGSGSGIFTRNACVFDIVGAMEYAACGGAHQFAMTSGVISNISGGNCVVSGGASSHTYTGKFGAIFIGGITMNSQGIAYGSAFANVTEKSFQQIWANTYTGTATGLRFAISGLSMLQTYGTSTTALPGNAAGIVSAGSEYA